MSTLPWWLLGLKPVPWGWTLLKLVWWSNDLSAWEKSLGVWTGLNAVNTGPGSFLKTVDTANGFDVGAIFLLNFTFGCCWDWPEYNLLDLKYSTFSDSRGLSMSGWYAARKHVISQKSVTGRKYLTYWVWKYRMEQERRRRIEGITERCWRKASEYLVSIRRSGTQC